MDGRHEVRGWAWGARVRRALLVLLPLALAACGPDRPGDNNAGAPLPGGADSDSVPGAGADVAVCLQGGPFVGEGPVAVEDWAGATPPRITALRWEAHPGCERLVIDLGSAAAGQEVGSGAVSAEVHRALSVVRISLPAAEAVEAGATDATFGGSLADRAYTVRSAEGGGFYVDVHLAGPAEVHVDVVPGPTRVVVDLRPGGGVLAPPAPTHPRVVLLSPRGPEATYPLTVTGYARTFEANVVVRIERAGEQVLETFTTATDYIDTWGHFSLTIPEGPAGPVQLHVGEYSARDGAWEGVSLPLEMR